jgi:hypothetical protein
LAVADGLNVDDPVFAPDGGIHLAPCGAQAECRSHAD